MGAKAQNKFSRMLLKIDQKKLEYYSECLDKANKPILLRDVFDAPTPVTKTATEADMNDLVKKAKELSEKLNRADSILHVDSSEFKAMKNALKALNQGLMQGVEPAELGGRLEALQAASMNYVKAKGVGMQATQLGKDRMDVALDICNLSVDYMDFYTSNERRKEVEDFEKDSFGNVLSPNINSEYVVAKEEVSNEIDEPEIDVL